MRAIAGLFHSIRFPRARAAGRCIAAVLAVLAASKGAHAERITSVQGDALAQMATDTLSQGAMVPFAWEQRVALVGLGMAGLHLGASTETAGRSKPGHALRSAAYRLALPLAGAALGNLIACDSLCDCQEMAADPLVGAMAGALVAHALDRDTSPPRWWTPTVAIGPGSYSIGVTGRF